MVATDLDGVQPQWTDWSPATHEFVRYPPHPAVRWLRSLRRTYRYTTDGMVVE